MLSKNAVYEAYIYAGLLSYTWIGLYGYVVRFLDSVISV